MLFRPTLTLATALLVALPLSAPAATIVIDDFDSALQVVTAFSPGMSTETDQGAGSMLGGERDISVEITSAIGAATVTAALGGGTFDVGNGPPPSSAIVVATWDGVDGSAAPGSVGGFAPVDFTFGGMGGDLLIDVVSADDNGTPIVSTITFFDSVGGSASVMTAISTAGLITIPITAFVGVDLSSITAVQSTLELGPDDDISIDFIGVEMRPIPEASTVIVWSSILALGCCGAWIKRNRG